MGNPLVTSIQDCHLQLGRFHIKIWSHLFLSHLCLATRKYDYRPAPSIIVQFPRPLIKFEELL